MYIFCHYVATATYAVINKQAHFLKFYLAILCQIISVSIVYAEPYIPDQDSVILQILPTTSDSRIQSLRQLRIDLSNSPDDLVRAVELARGYLQMGRTMADPRYEGYAQAALQPWWNMALPPPDVLILRAILRQRQHDFTDALSDLNQALQEQPANTQGWLIQAAVYQALGDYPAAYRSCLPLYHLKLDFLATACIASVSSLNGRASESYKALQKIIRVENAFAPQEKLWVLTILAETAARLEKNSEAESYFQAALAVNHQDAYLLGAYSDFLLDQNQPENVQTLLKQAVQSDSLLLRQTIAAQQLNAPEFEKSTETLKARFAASRLRGEMRHLREEAQFMLHLLHQPQKALKLAMENWQLHREPKDARILLEAALQCNDRATAQPVIDWLKSVNLEDSKLDTLVRQLS